LKVTGCSTIYTVDVVADGTGLSSRAGSALLALVARRLGLTDGLSAALVGTWERRSGYDPGCVLCDVAVMVADGGRCVSDLARCWLVSPRCSGMSRRFPRHGGCCSRSVRWSLVGFVGRVPSLANGRGGMGRLRGV
jgi:hypothetical protein